MKLSFSSVRLLVQQVCVFECVTNCAWWYFYFIHILVDRLSLLSPLHSSRSQSRKFHHNSTFFFSRKNKNKMNCIIVLMKHIKYACDANDGWDHKRSCFLLVNLWFRSRGIFFLSICIIVVVCNFHNSRSNNFQIRDYNTTKNVYDLVHSGQIMPTLF